MSVPTLATLKTKYENLKRHRVQDKIKYDEVRATRHKYKDRLHRTQLDYADLCIELDDVKARNALERAARGWKRDKQKRLDKKNIARFTRMRQERKEARDTVAVLRVELAAMTALRNAGEEENRRLRGPTAPPCPPVLIERAPPPYAPAEDF